ncbi:hypothetical protein [Chryseolinea lacunae]|nr:hypothetical protein [Chryseolinea lacunae]
MQRKFKRYFVLSSLLLLLLPLSTSVNACYESSDHEELRFMVFNPDLLHEKSWWSFFYSGRYNYLDAVTGTNDEDQLTREWMKKTKTKASFDDVWNCFFGSPSDSALQHNPFYTEIQKNQVIKTYLDVARQCEDVSYIPDGWHQDSAAATLHTRREAMIARVDEHLRKESDPFLQHKYAFQLIKLSWYANDYATFDRVFTHHFSKTPAGVLDWWAWHYKSMTYEGTKQVDSANYLHARVFSHSTNKMFPSKQYFSSRKLSRVLKLARTKEERADILVLAALTNPGRTLPTLLEVYDLAPDHKHLPLLISREINKLEDWLGSTKYAHTPIATQRDWDTPSMKNWKRDFDYLHVFTNAVQQLTSLKTAHPVFFNMSMACLKLMENDHVAASDYLARIQSDDPEVLFQQRVLNVILLAQQKDVRDPLVQDELGSRYVALLNDRTQKFESQRMLYSLSLYLRHTFASKGMVHLAGLFDNYAVNKFCETCFFDSFSFSTIRYFDRYATAADVERLIATFRKPDKNKLETVLLKPYTNVNYLYDLLSTKYLRQGDVNAAAKALKEVPDEFWFSFLNFQHNLDRNPFENTEVLDARTMTLYTKREIVQNLIALEREAKTNPAKRAANYFQLGNAWYNFSETSWFMIAYEWHGDNWNNLIATKFVRKKALGFYQQALASETDSERKARIVYMIAQLSDGARKKDYAKQYERYQNTDFYSRKSCDILRALAEAN